MSTGDEKSEDERAYGEEMAHDPLYIHWADWIWAGGNFALHDTHFFHNAASITKAILGRVTIGEQLLLEGFHVCDRRCCIFGGLEADVEKGNEPKAGGNMAKEFR